MSLFLYFSLPCPAEEGSDRVAFVGTWPAAGTNPPQCEMVSYDRNRRYEAHHKASMASCTPVKLGVKLK